MKFTIRALLALTAMVGFASAAIFAFPDPIASTCLTVLNTMISAALLSAAIYGRDSVRAFCIGAVISPLILEFWFLVSFPYGSEKTIAEVWEEFGRYAVELKFATVFVWALSLLGGIVSLVVRHIVKDKSA